MSRIKILGDTPALILTSDSSDYDVWKKKKTLISKKFDKADKDFQKKYPRLPSEGVRLSSSYKKDNSSFQKVLRDYQSFNKGAPKGFLSKYSKDKRSGKL